MLRIYIARHGQDVDNARGILNGHRDQPLTEFGENQALALAEKIDSSGISFDAVYSSPLQRAYATALTITVRLRLMPPKRQSFLVERNFGIMTGKRVRDIEKLCAPDVIRTKEVIYFLSPEGAETFPVLLERGKLILSGVMQVHPEGSVLLATHGDIGKMIYASYYGLSWQEVLTMFHFDNSHLLLLAEDSPADIFYA